MSRKYATFQNVEGDGTQHITIEIDDDGNITANANKKLSGLKAAELKYINGKWKAYNQDARNFLKNEKNKKNLNDNTTELYNTLDEKTQSKVEDATGFEPNNKNQAKAVTLSDLITKGIGNATRDFPRDPEGFFIGKYPLNQKDSNDFDYFKITCYDHQPGLDLKATGGNLFKIKDIDDRKKIRRGVVMLPMQPGISESNSVGWGDDQINPFQIAGANLAGAAMEEGSNLVSGQGFDLGSLIGATGETLKQFGNAINPALIKAYFAQQALGANIIGRSTGLTINNNVEVLFNSPTLRTFQYNYRFTPREPKEADHIKKIIRFFKKQMAPKRSNSRIFLKSPNVFKLKYTFKNGDSHPFLNNIKMCALNNFTVNYTPDGSYSTYDDDGGRGDGSMTSYQVGLSFKEITPIYNDDFWNDDEGQEGTGF